jgi:hypothetical protein
MEIISIFFNISLIARIIFFLTIILGTFFIMVNSCEPGYWMRFGQKGFNFWMVVVPTISGISGTLAFAGWIITFIK